MKKAGLLLILAGALVLGSCGTIKAAPPEGFAWTKDRSNIFKAVSPEGMKYRIRSTKNYPQKDLEFWEVALESHLLSEGYELFNEPGTFEAYGKKGVFFEWGLSYAGEDHIYLTALIVKGKKIIIAEAAGEMSIYNIYRDSIIESLTTISTR